MIFLWQLICNSSCHIEIWEYTSRSVFSMFLSTRIYWTYKLDTLECCASYTVPFYFFFPFFIFFFKNRILDCTYIHVIVYGVDTKEDKLFCCSNVIKTWLPQKVEDDNWIVISNNFHRAFRRDSDTCVLGLLHSHDTTLNFVV